MGKASKERLKQEGSWMKSLAAKGIIVSTPPSSLSDADRILNIATQAIDYLQGSQNSTAANNDRLVTWVSSFNSSNAEKYLAENRDYLNSLRKEGKDENQIITIVEDILTGILNQVESVVAKATLVEQLSKMRSETNTNVNVNDWDDEPRGQDRSSAEEEKEEDPNEYFNQVALLQKLNEQQGAETTPATNPKPNSNSPPVAPASRMQKRPTPLGTPRPPQPSTPPPPKRPEPPTFLDALPKKTQEKGINIPPAGPAAPVQGPIEPAKVEQAKEPGKVEPGKVEPGKVEPGKVEPGKVEPGKVEPGKVEPGKDEPEKDEPEKDEPEKDEPAKVEQVKEQAKVEQAKAVLEAQLGKGVSDRVLKSQKQAKEAEKLAKEAAKNPAANKHVKFNPNPNPNPVLGELKGKLAKQPVVAQSATTVDGRRSRIQISAIPTANNNNRLKAWMKRVRAKIPTRAQLRKAPASAVVGNSNPNAPAAAKTKPMKITRIRRFRAYLAAVGAAYTAKTNGDSGIGIGDDPTPTAAARGAPAKKPFQIITAGFKKLSTSRWKTNKQPEPEGIGTPVQQQAQQPVQPPAQQQQQQQQAELPVRINLDFDNPSSASSDTASAHQSKDMLEVIRNNYPDRIGATVDDPLYVADRSDRDKVEIKRCHTIDSGNTIAGDAKDDVSIITYTRGQKHDYVGEYDTTNTYDAVYSILHNFGNKYRMSQPTITNLDQAQEYLRAVYDYCRDKENTLPNVDISAGASKEYWAHIFKKHDMQFDKAPSAEFKQHILNCLQSPKFTTDYGDEVRDGFLQYLTTPVPRGFGRRPPLSAVSGNQGMCAGMIPTPTNDPPRPKGGRFFTPPRT